MKKIVILTTFFLVFFYSLKSQTDSAIQQNINFQTSKFKYLLEIANKYYKDSVDIYKISDAAFKTLLNSLDIQSTYFTKDEYKKYEEQSIGEAVGIGAELVVLSDTLTIIHLIPQSPAEEAGLKSGDKILFIDGNKALGLSKLEAEKLINGAKGTKVQLIVKRNFENSQLNEYTVTRNDYALPSITSSFKFNEIDKANIGYINVSRFSMKTDSEFTVALNNLDENGVNKLIIDFRGNPGGYLDQTIKMLNNFFEKGDTLLKIRGQNSKVDTCYMSDESGKYRDWEVIVLVDPFTASGSEIFAGVLQD